MTKRAKLITALVAAIGLVVVTPLAAVAYWVVTTQVAVTAQASTFSIAPYAVAAAPAGSSSSFAGWAGTLYYTAPLANDGATPWAGRSLSVAAGSGFGAAAVATAQVAFATASTLCENEATYSAVSPRNALTASTWTTTGAVASGASVYACIKLAVTDTDTRTPSGQAAPAPTLSVTTTALSSQGNWTDQESAAFTASSTGWTACTTGAGTATLTFAAPVQPGSYTIVRNDTGAAFSGNVAGNARTTLTLSNPATSGTENAATYVTISRSGTVVAFARLAFTSSGSGSAFTASLACA